MQTCLNINSVDNNTLLPVVHHGVADLGGRLDAGVDADDIECSINGTGGATGGDDSEATEDKRGTTGDALTACAALFPGIGTLSRIGRTTLATSIGLLANVWVLIWVTKVEAEVVDDESGLHDIWSLGEVSLGGLRTESLESAQVVWVGGGTEAGEHTKLTKVHGGDTDGEDGTLALWVLLLNVGKGADDLEWLWRWLGLGLDDGLKVTTWDHKDIELGEALLDFLVAHVSLESDTVVDLDGWGLGDKDAFKCLVLRIAWVLVGLVENLERTKNIHSFHSRVKGNEHLHHGNWTSGFFHGCWMLR